MATAGGAPSDSDNPVDQSGVTHRTGHMTSSSPGHQSSHGVAQQSRQEGPHPQSPAHHPATKGAASSAPPTESNESWVANGNSRSDSEANYPTSAVEILDLLRQRIAILSGGRDKQGQSILTFPAQHKSFTYQRESIRKIVQYLACIPAVDVREFGFSVIVDARVSSWSSTKVILRTLQEALPGQIHVAYILQPGQFWQKQQSSRGHSKEKAKLEFTTIKLSSVEKLTRHVDNSQLTNDLGGFLPYNHDQWLILRQDLEHFISLFNALMEHSTHIEQQIKMEQENSEADSIEDQLKHHLPLQDMMKRAPQDAIRKGNDLLRTLEQGRDESGTAITPDKINAVAVIKRLLEKIERRQVQLEELWKERKTSLEQALQIKSFEKSVQKVRSWLKTRGEEMLTVQSDIGSSVETVQSVLEQHEKGEAKSRLQYNLLTQLRRNADRYSGEQHYAAEGMQKQVSKLSAKFSKFETKMAARRSIIESSMQLHTSLRQWKEQCEVVAQVLKQEGVESGEKGVESHRELIQQLRQIGDVVLDEAGTLMELMISATRRRSSEGGGAGDGGSGGRRSSPDYTTGMNHVRRLMEEVENHRRRLGQLAEARKVQAEQLKQIDSCEKDAKQESRWLEYMLTQLSSTHGHVGDSVAAVNKLISEHSKFIETAKKSYKYGCGLISAAEKSRRSFQLESEPCSTLLANHTSCWERLSSGVTEVRERLKMAHYFHSLLDEVMSSFTEWTMPLHELPKTPELVEERLKDIAEHRQNIFKKTQECIDTGRNLIDRLGRPVLQEAEFLLVNERAQNSQSFLQVKVGELERKAVEVEEILPQQEQLLSEFITYCQFEKKIEKVLLWLQSNGLRKLPTFSIIGEDRDEIQKQLIEFEAFQVEAGELSPQVEQLLSSAGEVEAEIVGFRSDLGKKAESLKGVWEKFLQRIKNRATVLTMALSYYTNLQQIRSCTTYLMSALSPRAISDGGGRAYLEELVSSKEELDELFESTMQEGQELVEIFSKPPVDPGNPVLKISKQLQELQEEVKVINDMWKEAWQLDVSEREKPIGRSPGFEEAASSNDHLLSSSDGGVFSEPPEEKSVAAEVKKVSKEVKMISKVDRRNSDKYSELEEEAYEYLEWVETQYDSFIVSHSKFHDNPDGALLLKNKYDEFLKKLEPTFCKVKHVLDLLSQLRPQAPSLVSSIDQLSQVVSERVKKHKDILTQCSTMLNTFAQFCSLFKEVDSNLLVLEETLCKELPSGVDSAQEMLEQGTPLAEKVEKDYKEAKSLGESFLTVTSEMLCNRGGPKLEVGGACTSVAVDLGDLEGRCPDLLNLWTERERNLTEIIDWQTFKLSADQVCAWLKESAELFLQNRTDIGTSLETAEDLLTEHEEFQIRAQRTATEVTSLLAKNEKMQSRGHQNAQQIRDLTADLQNLHGNFESRFQERKKILESTVDFYRISQELCQNMEDAIERCGTPTGQDLPSHLKITSISSRLSNLQHQGDNLVLTLVSKPQATKTRQRLSIKRSDSTSASEISIKDTLASLKTQFATYKDVFEKRRVQQNRVDPISSKKPINSVSPTLSEIRTNLKSPPQILIHQRQGSLDGMEIQRGGELEREEKDDRYRKSASLGRRSTMGAVREGINAVRSRHRSGSVVMEKVAALNEKSKGDVVPLQDPGANFGSPTHTRAATSPSNRKSQDSDSTPKPSAGSESVPLRRKSKGLSKAERSQRIEDIKKLFESSEIANLTAAASDVPVWVPKSRSSVSSVSSISDRDKLEPKPVPKPISEKKQGKPEPVPEKRQEKPEPVSEKKQEKPVSLPPPPAIAVSPPPESTMTTPPAGSETRVCLNTSPTVIRTVLKDRTPTKKQVIPIVIDTTLTQPNANSADSSADSANESKSSPNAHKTRLTRSASPDAVKEPSPKGRGKGLQKGKVSSLRQMFDSQSKDQTSTTDSNLRPKIIKPKKESQADTVAVISPVRTTAPPRDPLTSSPRETAKVVIEETSESVPSAPCEGVPPAPSLSDSHKTTQTESTDHTCPSEVQHDALDPKFLKYTSPPRPLPPSPSVLSPCHTPPPRPPPPQGYHDKADSAPAFEDSDSEPESDTASEAGSSLLGESDLELVEDQILVWSEDEVDSKDEVDGVDERDSPYVQSRPLKSLRHVLSDVISSEYHYLQSLAVLVDTYLVHLRKSLHVPTFLQNSETSIFGNTEQLYTFQSGFYNELSQHEESLEGICNSFIENEAGFKCYIPFLVDMEQRLKVLTEYGGSFFTDKQREIEDEVDIVGHFCRPKERLVQYLNMFKDMCYCAQKQYLHGVSLVKDVLRMLMSVLRSVDNALCLRKFRGYQDAASLSDGRMVCQEQFLVYNTRGKKKVHIMDVLLHHSKIVFARPRKIKGKKGETYLELYETLDTTEMHLLETYKSQEDKFALCEGRLTPDNLIILQPIYQPLLMKRVWLQEIRPILQKREISRGVLVNEDEMPLPAFFRDVDKPFTMSTPRPEGEGLLRAPSLRRRLTLRRRKKKTGSGETTGSIVSGASASSRGLSKTEKREMAIRSSMISSTTSSSWSTTSSLPAPPLADVHLASLSEQGSFLPEQQNADEDIFEVVMDFEPEGDDFLRVEQGQRVEVLDMSNEAAWMVLTLPRSPEEQQLEGFIPPQYLRPVGGGDHTPRVSCSSSGALPVASSEGKNELFEAETGQEVPQGSGTPKGEEEVDAGNSVKSPVTAGGRVPNQVCSEETTGQSLTSPLHHPSNAPTSNQTSLADNQGFVTSSPDDKTLPPGNADPASTVSDNRSQPLPPSPPPHADLLTKVDSSEIVVSPSDNASSYPSNSSREHTSSPPPIEEKFNFKGEPLSSSLHSLPTSFSPTSTPAMPPHKFLGYNPMLIPTHTMSQPNIPKIRIDPVNPPRQQEARQKGELSQLQWATIKATPETSLEDFDPVEMYIAIADFMAIEKSSISLRAGQCVQVLDDSRSDWWLVMAADSESQGWVPANYLEHQVIDGPRSPPPDPFEDETGELACILMKVQSPSEIDLNRRELYRGTFLSAPGQKPPEPTEAQLRGEFAERVPYIAVTEVQAEHPEQLSVIQDQPLQVLDSKRTDWWLVRTLPEDDSTPPREGWVKASLLQPDTDIREDVMDPSLNTDTANGGESLALHHAVGHNAATLSPPGPSQWVVLADYTATETGMLSVNEGELVEVLDTSRNEWCLVKPVSRSSLEGWVPMAYLNSCSAEGVYPYANQTPSPRFRSLSSSEESDTPTEVSDHSSTVLSPDLLETYDDEEQRLDAEERRRYVLSELVKTEQDYVQKLYFCLMNYDPEVNDESAPRALRSLRNTLLGNLEDIYLFHKDKLLPRLLESEVDQSKLGDAFVQHEDELKLYIAYCNNKASSDDIYHEFFAYFEQVRLELKDRQKLPDYLILPIQRITKYGLLLSDFQKYSIKSGLSAGNIEKGLEVTRNISVQANNVIHLSLIETPNRTAKFGELVIQDLFMSQETHRQTSKERRVFLFERALLITKRKRKEEKEIYAIKEQLMLHDVSMIQDMDAEKRNLIIYDMITGTKYLLHAAKTSLRDIWLTKSCHFIQQAKKDVSNQLASRSRSSSEPMELTRVSSFARKSLAFRRESREGSRRKVRRPNSSTGVRGVTTNGTEEMVPAGTEYVVMECIVLEGEDDLTLEPGEVVELVKETLVDAPLLRVRTRDQNKLEGSIPSSYLRKRDSVKGLRMETTPKFTMQPDDLDLPTGSNATISCAFNGYPAPSIIWRRDHEILTSDERRKIMSCGTSSVLEVSRLEYDDEGRYSCYITNSMGSDSATMTLTLHGPPSEPPKPVVSKITSTSVKLKWAVPDMDGGVPILSYQIEMLQGGFDQWQPIVQQPRNYFVVKTLEPSTSYQFRVSAVNEYGFSNPSEPSDVVVTKGKGLMNSSPSFKKKILPMVSDENKDDELNVEDYRQPFIRRGSISSAYDIMPEELGRGRFGIVHCCHHRQSGLKFAAKFVRLRSRKKTAIRKEVEMLQRVRGKSPYILEFQEAFERGRNLIIITELVPSGELLESIVAENNLTEAVAVGYLTQLLSAVDTLHRIKIAHLDIRPENILLNFGRIKLIDFGTARDLSQTESSPLFASSVEFCAPEVVSQDILTVSADMWSIGVLTYVLLSGLSPFFADNIQTVVERILDARYSFYREQFDSVSQEAKDFISALLQKSPEYRMSVGSALNHSWIKMLGGVGERVSSPWPMAKLDISQLKSFIARRKWHTSSVAVDDTTVYGPRSMTCFSPTPPDFQEQAKNENPPRLWDGPSSVAGREGYPVTLQYQVSGSPIPSVTWEHSDNGEVKMSLRTRVVELSGGVTSLTISKLQREDEGVYICTAVNSLGSISCTCTLTVLVIPGAPSDVNAIILGSYNSALISWLPPTADGNAPISKYLLERRRLEFDMWEEVSAEIEGTAHVVDDLLPGVTYIFRVSAINDVGMGHVSEPSEPVTIENNQEYDSDSPMFERIRMKTSPYDLEYQSEEELSRGKFTMVVKCREKTTDQVFVGKVMQVGESEELREKALQELEILRGLVHPRLVSLEDSFDNKDRIIAVLEYLGGGTLEEYVAYHVTLTEYTTTRLTRKIMEGLQYLHDSRIIHVNLTPDNIFLTSGYGDLKIGGFGTARYIETGNQLTDLTSCGVEFLAPEAISLQPLTTGADIWSAGVLACHMVTGHSPFLRETDEATILAITSSSSLDLTSKDFTNLSPECLDFIAVATLARNPRKRLTAQQCQRHKWLSGSGGNSRRSSLDHTSSPPSRCKSLGSSSPGGRRRSGSLGGNGGDKNVRSKVTSSSRYSSTDHSHR